MLAPSATSVRVASQQVVSAGVTEHAEFQAEHRVGLVIVAPPTMQIGQRVLFRVRANAMRDAQNYAVHTEVIGDPLSTEMRGAGGASQQRSRINLRRDVSADVHVLEHTFSQPGLYLIRSCAGPIGLVQQEARVVDVTCTQAWLLAERSGMRTFASWDARILESARGARYALYGSYGPFVDVQAPSSPQASQRNGVTSRALGAVALSVVPSSTTYTGTFTYSQLNPVLNSNVRVSVGAGVIVSVQCVWPQSSMQSAFTDADGGFSIPKGSCSNGVTVTASLVDQYVNVTGPNGAAVGASCYIASSGYVADCRVGNSYAAGAFDRIRRAAPVAFARFGRSRARVNVWANDNPADGTFETFYSSGSDRIQINASRADGDDGEFVAVHEYGHAYHWRAIEAPASYNCTNGTHEPGVENQRSCAFVEGFADFFAAWLVADRVTPFFFFSAADFENNRFRGTGNGMQDEGAVAGFMLDLVDGSSDVDGIPGDDDTMVYPATFVEQAIRVCTASLGFSALDGTDQFVYCIERTLNSAYGAVPVAYQPTWRQFAGSLSPPNAPNGYNAGAVRAAWQWNLFNMGGLQ